MFQTLFTKNIAKDEQNESLSVLLWYHSVPCTVLEVLDFRPHTTSVSAGFRDVLIAMLFLDELACRHDTL